MLRYLFLSASVLAASINAHASSVVYDSLTSFVPPPPPFFGWLNGDIEQGVRLTRLQTDQPLVKAEFFVRNGFSFPLETSATLRFYEDVSGAPGDLLATVEDTLSFDATSLEQVSVALPNLLLPSDPIWVTWLFGSTSNSGGVMFGASPTIGTEFGTRAIRSRLDPASWTLDDVFADGGPALRLTAVPEPSGALLCASLLLLAAAPIQRGHRSKWIMQPAT